MQIEQKAKDPVINIALDTIKINKQALVFCSSKRSAEKQAEEIAKKCLKDPNAEAVTKQILAALPHPTKQCEREAKCTEKGIAFHHAGLTTKQRSAIEDGFRSGAVKIICCTPTLAAGLNVPAFRTVLRDLKRFTGKWGMQYIPVLEYEQMCVVPGTLIRTNQGDVPVEKISMNSQLLITTYNENTKRITHNKLIKTFKKEAKETYLFKTKNNYRLQATSNHPIYVRREKEEKWIDAKKIKMGDELLLLTQEVSTKIPKIPFHNLIPNQKTYLYKPGALILDVKKKFTYTDKEIAQIINVNPKNIYHYKYDKKALPLEKARLLIKKLNKEDSEYIKQIKSKYGHVINVPMEVNQDFLWLAGIIASDGTLTSTKDARSDSETVTIKITNKNKKIISKAKKILIELVGSCYIGERHPNVYSLEKGATLLAHILKDHFGIPFNKKSHSVRTPKLLENAPLPLIGAYISGVFDGDGSYDKKTSRICFVTASSKFQDDLQRLFSKMAIICRTTRIQKETINIIRGKECKFIKPYYILIFQKKQYLKQFKKYSCIVKVQFKDKFSEYNNISSYHNTKDQREFDVVSKIKINNKKTTVYNLSIDENNNYFANNILVHNCGRAGRPGMEAWGEAIAIAKSESEAQTIADNYIYGEVENIQSKLAVEPVLRTYILSLVASGFVKTKHQLIKFFEKTFYAHQFGDMSKLALIIDRMVLLLTDYKFLESAGIKAQATEFMTADQMSLLQGDEIPLVATPVGKRVSELYLDPYTANQLITSMKAVPEAIETKEKFAILHMLVNTLEMEPLLRIKVKEREDIEGALVQCQNYLLGTVPDQFSYDYEDYLRTIKTTLFFNAWIDEEEEETILEKFDIRPGETRAKINNIDWLIRCSIELSKQIDVKNLIAPLARLQKRISYGAKEELLTLLRLKGVGRVRARAIFNAGFTDIGKIKAASFEQLEPIVGKALATSILTQAGATRVSNDLSQYLPGYYLE